MYPHMDSAKITAAHSTYKVLLSAVTLDIIAAEVVA